VLRWGRVGEGSLSNQAKMVGPAALATAKKDFEKKARLLSLRFE